MTPAEFETVYEAMAETIDAVGAEQREVFLAKLCLALAHELGDGGKVLDRIAECSQDLARG
jgi:truncated hemoglobin YjbI